MKVKGIVHEDFVNFKLPSMFIIFPHCSFKCEKESGVCCCQNSSLALEETKDVSFSYIADAYVSNPITMAVVFGGLEPFDSFNDMLLLVKCLRLKTNDPIVIYSGYTKDELKHKIKSLFDFGNIIIKFGRYIPGHQPHLDPVLGVKLASDNQYAEKIS